MTRKLDRSQIAEVARIVTPAVATPAAAAEVAHPARTFQLPARLYGLTVAAYLSFLGILGTAFATRELILPMAIFVVAVVAGFGVPAMWARMHPESREPAMRWSEFGRQGIVTHTGRLDARNATVQVLILPVLIMCWGIAIAVIAASV